MDLIGGQWKITLLVTVLIAAFLHGAIKFVRHRRLFKDLPKPPHDFFWGHLKLLGEVMARFPKNPPTQIVCTTIANEHNLGPVFYLDLWPLGPVIVVVTDPELAFKYTVTSNLPKHPLVAAFVDSVIGKNNMVGSDGPIWKRSHQMVAPAFSDAQIKSKVSMIADEAMTYRQGLLEKAEDGRPFLMEELTNGLTFDIICTSTFGFSLESQKKGSLLLKTFFEVVDAWCIDRNTWNPFSKFWNRLKRHIGVRNMDKQLDKIIRERYETIRKDNVDLSKKQGLRMLDLLLRERFEQPKISGQPSSKALDHDYTELVRTNIKTLLLGGTGTTTDTLCFVYMLISTHPEVVKKMRAEHDRVFGPTIEETYMKLQKEPSKINELEYTTNVIKETLRLFPIGPSARAGRSNDDYLEWHGRRYPLKDFMVFPLQHCMQLDPKNFANPGVFDPDRFARDEYNRLAWRPFERGVRSCIGQNMAMDEMKVTLLLTVRDIDFECHNLQPYDKPRVKWWDLDTVYGDMAYQEFTFEAKPRDGMPMVVKKSGYGSK